MCGHLRHCTGLCLLLHFIDAFLEIKFLYLRSRLELAYGCHTMHALKLERFGRLQDTFVEPGESWGEGEGDEGSDENQEDSARRVSTLEACLLSMYCGQMDVEEPISLPS